MFEFIPILEDMRSLPLSYTTPPTVLPSVDWSSFFMSTTNGLYIHTPLIRLNSDTVEDIVKELNATHDVLLNADPTSGKTLLDTYAELSPRGVHFDKVPCIERRSPPVFIFTFIFSAGVGVELPLGKNTRTTRDCILTEVQTIAQYLNNQLTLKET